MPETYCAARLGSFRKALRCIVGCLNLLSFRRISLCVKVEDSLLSFLQNMTGDKTLPTLRKLLLL